MSIKEQPSAYLWGECDARAGLKVTENPYDADTPESREWTAGFIASLTGGGKPTCQ
jgi:hypothetical protein